MLDIDNSLCTTRHLNTLLEIFLTILLLTFVLKQQRNVNNKYENEYISVCCMANDNNFSSFRDLCLETVKRFIDYDWKCYFRLSNAKDILQDGSFLFLNFLFHIVAIFCF